MPVVMESDHFTIVFINSGCGNDRTTKITPNVFYNNSGIAEVGFGINIKTLLVFTITFLAPYVLPLIELIILSYIDVLFCLSVLV